METHHPVCWEETFIQQLRWPRSPCGEMCSRQREEGGVESKAHLRPEWGAAVEGEAG